MPEGSKTPSADEQDLLQRARRLEAPALGAVFDAFYEPLYRYIYRHIGHATTAEDLTAEVFRRFLEQIRDGHGPTSHLKAWLYRVAHNLTVDELRRRKHQDHEPLDEDLHSADEPISKQVQQAIRQQQVRLALRQLSSKQQAVLTLKFLQGLENEEVARVLQMTAGTVRALQQRGLRALRRHLEGTGALDEEDE
jgi:RNA polymerase sigma-70 factor (ECF subfamily)